MNDQKALILEEGIALGVDKTLKVIQGLSKGISSEDLAESYGLSVGIIEEIRATANLASTWMAVGRQ